MTDAEFYNWQTLRAVHDTPSEGPPINHGPTPGPSNFNGVKHPPNVAVKQGNVGPQGPRAIFHGARFPTS